MKILTVLLSRLSKKNLSTEVLAKVGQKFVILYKLKIRRKIEFEAKMTHLKSFLELSLFPGRNWQK